MMMDSPSITIPLQTDEQGTIRVRGTRVTFESMIQYYLQGQSPEDVQDAFSSVPLNEVYAIIAYYLANREALDGYLNQQAAKADRQREAFEATYPPKMTRVELLKRREDNQQQDT